MSANEPQGKALRTVRKSCKFSEGLALDIAALSQRCGLSENQLVIEGLKLLFKHSIRYVKPTNANGIRLLERWKDGPPDDL